MRKDVFSGFLVLLSFYYVLEYNTNQSSHDVYYLVMSMFHHRPLESSQAKIDRYNKLATRVQYVVESLAR